MEDPSLLADDDNPVVVPAEHSWIDSDEENEGQVCDIEDDPLNDNQINRAHMVPVLRPCL